MRTALILAMAGAAFALGGCGDATTQDAAPDAPTTTRSSEQPAQPVAADRLPACRDVWKVGEKLPRGYDGCLAGGEPADDPRPLHCASGTTLHRHAVRWYAVEGGKVIRTAESSLREDRVFRRVLAACTA